MVSHLSIYPSTVEWMHSNNEWTLCNQPHIQHKKKWIFHKKSMLSIRSQIQKSTYHMIHLYTFLKQKSTYHVIYLYTFLKDGGCYYNHGCFLEALSSSTSAGLRGYKTNTQLFPCVFFLNICKILWNLSKWTVKLVKLQKKNNNDKYVNYPSPLLKYLKDVCVSVLLLL